MTVNAINGSSLSALSAIDGIALASISEINGQTKAASGPSNVTDDFNRADNASLLGTASDGVHAWTAETGTWGVQSNQGYCPTLSGGLGYATVDYGARDCTLQVTIPTVNRPFGVILGWEGTAADVIRIRCFIIATVHRIQIQLFRTGQSNLNLGTVDGTVWANGDVMKVVVSGSTVSVYRNNVLVTSATDARFNDITGTKHGLYTEITTVRFDDLSIAP